MSPRLWSEMGAQDADTIARVRNNCRLGALGAIIQLTAENVGRIFFSYLQLVSETYLPLVYYEIHYLYLTIVGTISTLLLARGFQSFGFENENRFAFYAYHGYYALALFRIAFLFAPIFHAVLALNISTIIVLFLSAVALLKEKDQSNSRRLYLVTTIVLAISGVFAILTLVRNIELWLFFSITYGFVEMLVRSIIQDILNPLFLALLFLRKIT